MKYNQGIEIKNLLYVNFGFFKLICCLINSLYCTLLYLNIKSTYFTVNTFYTYVKSMLDL